MIKYKSNGLLAYLYTIIVILIPFLYQYASPFSFLSLGDFCLIIVVGISIFFLLCNKNFSFDGSVLKLVCVLLGLNIFPLLQSQFYNIKDSITLIFKMVLYLFAISTCTIYFNFKLCKKFYFILAFCFGSYLIIQYLTFNLTGKYLPIYLKNEWLFSWEKRPKDLAYIYTVTYSGQYRPSSLFVEPGYYALYVIPALAISLLMDKKIIYPLFITLTLFLSTSGAGILISCFVWTYFFVSKFVTIENKKIKLKINSYFFIFIISVIFVLLLMFTTNIFYRIFNSFNARISRGFIIFHSLPSLNKIFGVGTNNISNYMKYYKITTVYDELNLNSGATYSTYLVQYGIVGYIFLIIFSVKLIKNSFSSKLSLCLGLIIILFMIFEDILFIYRMIFLFSFLIYYVDKDKQEKYIKDISLTYPFIQKEVSLL